MKWLWTIFFVACGGVVAGPNDDSGMSDSGGGDVVQIDGGTNCTALSKAIDAARQQLKVCCPFCDAQQCSHVTQDVCCPFSTTATQTADFDSLVTQFKQNCKSACPAIPCPKVPSLICNPNAMSQEGSCQ